MKITSKNGQWFDENGRQLTEEEKATLKQQVKKELDGELNDTGFEGWIKNFLSKQLDRQPGSLNFTDKAGAGDFFDKDESTEGKAMADQAIQVAIKGLDLAIVEMTDKLEKLKAERAKLADQLFKKD